MDIKDRIKKAMSENGINARELSKRSGVSESSISRYLLGQMEPRANAAAKIAKALHVDPVWLMGLEDNDRNESVLLTIELDRLTPANQAALIATYHALLNSQKEGES